jgi:hypothetical protein
LGALSLTAAVLGSPALAVSPASACTIAEAAVFAVDPALRSEDRAAPEPFTDLKARVTRSPESTCDGDTCIASSCGEFGIVLVTFALPPDVQSGRETIGYRMIWQQGKAPVGVSSNLDKTWPLDASDEAGRGQISFTIGYDDVADLDAEIALVAVDRAGNESSPSEPVHLSFSGCTIDLFSGTCEQPASCNVTDPGRDHVPNGYIASAAVLWVIGFALRQRRKRTRAPSPAAR